MHSLLKRQIRKYLPSDSISQEDISEFLKAINSSYDNYDEQLKMTERANAISSDELYEANKKLNEESESQKKIISSLSAAIQLLNKNIRGHDEVNIEKLDALNLANLVENLAEEILKINQERENLLENLEHKNDSLNNYAHMVSHDLKSPLRNIYTLLTWIRDEDFNSLSEEGKFNVTEIFKGIEKMDYLIEGILNYATLDFADEEGKSIDTRKLVEHIIKINNIPGNIDVHVDKNLPKIKGNRFRLEQLFQNLISNAVKAMDKCEGKIIVKAREIKGHWEFLVSDNGRGIPEEYQEKIFKIFQKLDNKTTSSGIGLSIVKRIVYMFGGQVWVESKLGEGSTFYFTLKKS